jgi:glycosyltransferase involved in cell wall biosynthesis
MKILFLSDDFPPQISGGAGRVAYTLAKAFQALGHTVAVITTTQDQKMQGEDVFEGIPVHRIFTKYHIRWRAYRSLYNPQTVSRVRVIFRDFKPDSIHAHNIHWYLSYACLREARRVTEKVFLTAHDVMLFHYGKLDEAQYEFNGEHLQAQYRVSVLQQFRRYGLRYNPLRNVLIRHYLTSVRRIFAVSEALKEALVQNGITNVSVNHNGIDVHAWTVEREAVDVFRSKHGITTTKNIFFGGRLSAMKGGEAIIQSLVEVKKRIPMVRLLIAGNRDGYFETLEKRAVALGVHDCLVPLGWLRGQELVQALHASDVVVTPSLYLDPVPTVNLEAMACSKPVITSIFTGGRELVQQGITGYVLNPQNTQDLANRLIEILSNDDIRTQMGKAGYGLVAEEFSAKSQAQELLRYYAE